MSEARRPEREVVPPVPRAERARVREIAIEPRPAAAAHPPELTRRERVAAMTGVLLALLLAALDQTIVSTAGPAIQRDLHVAPEVYPWITTAYLVASTVMVPIYGKLSDLYGRRPILLVGVAIFLAGSLLCGLAPSVLPLVAFRALQGLGAAALFTSTFAVIADLFPPAERGKYTGFIGGVMGIASVVGPLVGGVITDLLGWHWVFFVNLPIGAVALWFIAARMPKLRLAHPGGVRPRIDLAGAATLVVGVVPLLIALSLGRTHRGSGGFAWGSWQILTLFAIALAGIVSFLVVERRAASPILDLRLFRGRIIGLGTAAVFVLGAGFLMAVVFLPLYLVNVVGVSATRAGLTMMPLTLGVVVASISSGQIAARVGRYRALLLGGLVLLCGGFALMAFTLAPDSTQGDVTWRMVLVGLGIGPTFPLFTLLVQNAARQEEMGVVTAALTFARSLGQVIGVALCGTLFAAALASAMARHVGAEMEALSPGARALLAGVVPTAATGVGGERPAGALAFDTATARARIRQGSAATAAHDRGAALAAVDRIAFAVRRGFTDATRRLYLVGLGLAAITLAISLGIPEVPLRRSHGPPSPAPID